MKLKKLEDEIAELYKDVYYFSLSRVEDEDAAGDIVQNSMEKALMNIDSLKRKETLRAWVMQIAANEVRLYYRSLAQYRSIFCAKDENYTEELEIQLQEITSMEADLLDSLVTEEEQLNLIKALLTLEEKYQGVIRLKAINEMSLVKAAEILGINVNTARTRYARGLRLLKEAYLRMEKVGMA